MAKCKKCEKDVIITAKDVFKCVNCQNQFHSSCISETLTRGSKANWSCEVCISNTKAVSNSNSDDRGHIPVLKAISDLREEMIIRWESNDKKLDKMQKNISQMNSELTSLKAKFAGVEKQVIITDQKVEQLVAENNKLKDELTLVKCELSDLQQHTRKNNIVISGIPILPRGANVFPILEKIAKILQLQYYRTDINAAHWLPIRGGGREYQSIIVAFVSRVVKHEWILARRHRKSLMANEIDDKFPQTQIYINDQLTQKSRELFNAARTLLKQEKLASVWTNDGIVMARRSPAGRPFRVTSLQALAEKAPPPRADASATEQLQADASNNKTN